MEEKGKSNLSKRYTRHEREMFQGKRLTERCDRMKMTREVIAGRVQVNRLTLYRWERGESRPREYELIKLCEVIETSPDYLLGFTDDPNEIVPLSARPSARAKAEAAAAALKEKQMAEAKRAKRNKINRTAAMISLSILGVAALFALGCFIYSAVNEFPKEKASWETTMVRSPLNLDLAVISALFVFIVIVIAVIFRLNRKK